MPGCTEINASGQRYAELLAVRGSSPVFALPTAAEVQKRLKFPLAGPSATPGVITMTLDARGVDRRWKSLVVVLIATPSEVQEADEALRTAVATLRSKAPDDVESYRAFVLELAETVSKAAKGGDEAEAAAIERIRTALA